MTFDSGALSDLDDIYDHIAADSLSAADIFVDLLLDTCQAIARSPGIGHRRQDLTTRDVLFLSVRGYVIVYRKQQRDVQIVAVTEGSQNLKHLLRRRLNVQRTGSSDESKGAK